MFRKAIMTNVASIERQIIKLSNDTLHDEYKPTDQSGIFEGCI